MTAPNIPHTSTCTDPRSVFRGACTLWESAVGQMRRTVYGCPTCGETAQIERFEAFEVEEDSE